MSTHAEHDDHEPSAIDERLAAIRDERHAEQVIVNADPVPGAPVEYLAERIAEAIAEHRDARAELRAARQDALDHDDAEHREQVRKLTELRCCAEDGLLDAVHELLDHTASRYAPAEQDR